MFAFECICSPAGRQLALENAAAAQKAWSKKPKAVQIKFDKLSDEGALGANWNSIASYTVPEEDSTVDADERTLSRQLYCVFDRNVLAALKRPLNEAESALGAVDLAGALLRVRVRVLRRGTCEFNAALYAPTRSMLAHARANNGRLLDDSETPTTVDTLIESGESLITLGRVTSERGFFHTQGQGGGIATIGLKRWLDHRRVAEAQDARLRNRLLVKNIKSNYLREVLIELL